MYGAFGGCTTLFHLAVKHPILVLALSLLGFAAQVESNPGPGDRLGTDSVLSQVEQKVVKDHPDLAQKAVELRAHFDDLDLEPNESGRALDAIDSCTISGDFSDKKERREAAWLLYLDTYSRLGERRANELFRRPPRP
jgi:hypothetical protein